MLDERIVRFRPRAILTVIGVVLAVAIVLEVIWVTRSVIIWVLIALFLAMALNPAVEFLVRRGMKRGPAVGIVFVGAILVIVGIAATFVPTLVREVNDLADAVPGYIDDLTRGRGRLGFLERDYHIVERAREAIEKSGAGGVLGLSNTALIADEEHPQRRHRRRHDRLPDAVHAARGAGAGSSGSTACCRSRRSRAGARSAATSTARSAATSPATSRSA